MKKLSCLICLLALVFAFANAANATIYTWSDASGVDHSFATLANWSPTPTTINPLVDDFLVNYLAGKSGPQIGTGVNFAVYRFKVGNVAASEAAVVTINGGSLTSNRETYLGVVSGAAGTIDMYSGSFIDNKSLYICYAATGTVNLHGGDFYVKTGYSYTTTVGTGTTEARLNILGGNFTAGNGLIVGTNGLVNITEGALRVAGDYRSQIEALVNSGKIGSYGIYGDLSKFSISYNSDTASADYNKTLITAIPEPATMILLGLGAAALSRRNRK